MKQILKKSVKRLVVLLVLMLGFASCSKKNSKNLLALHCTNSQSSNYTPVIYTAINGGLAEKNGLAVDVELNDGIEPIITGKADVRLNNLTNALFSAGNGADIVIFAGTMGGGHIVYANKKLADSLSDPKNWKGKSIGIRPQVTSQLVLNAVLKEKYGYGPEDVRFRYYDDDHAGIAACVKGEVDITSVYYSLADTSVAQGLVQIGELVDLSPDYACCRQTANGPKFRSDRQLFVKWTKALIEAWKVYNTDQKRSIDVVKKITRQDDQWVYDHIYNKEKTAHITFNPDPYYNGVLVQYDICIEHKFVNDHPRPLSDFFDISVYADALREVINENPGDSFYKDMWAYFVTHNDKYPDFAKNYPANL